MESAVGFASASSKPQDCSQNVSEDLVPPHEPPARTPGVGQERRYLEKSHSHWAFGKRRLHQGAVGYERPQRPRPCVLQETGMPLLATPHLAFEANQTH